MKTYPILHTLFMGLGLMMSCSLFAQKPIEGLVPIHDAQIHWGPVIDIAWKANLKDVQLHSQDALEIIPLLVGPKDTLELPRVLVLGKIRNQLYQRKGLPFAHRYAQILRHNPQKTPVYQYTTRVEAQPWMDGAELKVITDRCGCGWQSLLQGQEIIAELVAPKFRPQLSFLAPVPEKKIREKCGQAYLDFPVNETKIYPEYRKNPSELFKLWETIKAVQDDPYSTMTSFSIKGYASPEGSYANNARLAEGRAHALLKYVTQLYDFGQIERDVESVPEDWEGLERLVAASRIDHQEAILQVIRDEQITDPDVRNEKLKQIAEGVPYRFLLKEFYPALRHSDYKVRYYIRDLTTEEAKALIFTEPSKLSLEEMYRVAQCYEPGSEAYNETFYIAVRIYPDSPVANLNAANVALNNQDVDKAEKFLAKAAPGPEKEMAEKALQELKIYLNQKF